MRTTCARPPPHTLVLPGWCRNQQCTYRSVPKRMEILDKMLIWKRSLYFRTELHHRVMFMGRPDKRFYPPPLPPLLLTYYRNAGVYGYTTTAMHDNVHTPPPSYDSICFLPAAGFWLWAHYLNPLHYIVEVRESLESGKSRES